MRCAQWWSFCFTTDTWSRKVRIVTGAPFIVTPPSYRPGPGSSVIRFIKEVFPLPLGPMMASTSPAFTVPLMPLRVSE